MFEYIKYREYGIEVAAESNTHDTLMHTTSREDINDLLMDGYKIDDDILPDREQTKR